MDPDLLLLFGRSRCCSRRRLRFGERDRERDLERERDDDFSSRARFFRFGGVSDLLVFESGLSGLEGDLEGDLERDLDDPLRVLSFRLFFPPFPSLHVESPLFFSEFLDGSEPCDVSSVLFLPFISFSITSLSSLLLGRFFSAIAPSLSFSTLLLRLRLLNRLSSELRLLLRL